MATIWCAEGGQIATIDEVYIVKILLRTQGGLGKGGRRCAAHVIVEKGVVTAAGGATAPTMGVEEVVVTALECS